MDYCCSWLLLFVAVVVGSRRRRLRRVLNRERFYVGIGTFLRSRGGANDLHNFHLTTNNKANKQNTTPNKHMNNAQAQQFAALQKAVETYKNDARMADHMRRREVDMMNRAAEQNRREEEELRIAHGEIGEEVRKQKNLEEERKRCKEAIEADRQAIVQITSELQGIEVLVVFLVCVFVVVLVGGSFDK